MKTCYTCFKSSIKLHENVYWRTAYVWNIKNYLLNLPILFHLINILPVTFQQSKESFTFDSKIRRMRIENNHKYHVTLWTFCDVKYVHKACISYRLSVKKRRYTLTYIKRHHDSSEYMYEEYWQIKAIHWHLGSAKANQTLYQNKY